MSVIDHLNIIEDISNSMIANTFHRASNGELAINSTCHNVLVAHDKTAIAIHTTYRDTFERNSGFSEVDDANRHNIGEYTVYTHGNNKVRSALIGRVIT
jgi:hypothetical protein